MAAAQLNLRQVEKHFRAGLPLAEIAALHGVGKSTVHRLAQKHAWRKDLVQQIADARLEAEAGDLIRDQIAAERAAAGQAAPTAADMATLDREAGIRLAARRQIEVIREHKAGLGRLHLTSMRLLARLDRVIDLTDAAAAGLMTADEQAELAQLRLLIGDPASMVRTIAQSMARYVTLERQAHGIRDVEPPADGADRNFRGTPRPIGEILKIVQPSPPPDDDDDDAEDEDEAA